VTVDANFNPVGPIGYFTKDPDPVNGFVSTRKMKRRISVMGGLLRHQTSFLNGRLLGFTGARFDSIRYRHRDFLTAASSFTPFIPGYQVGDQIRKTITSFNPNLGANFKLKENFRVYASYSRSFFQSQGDNPVEIANPTYKPETADGWDYGFKGSFFGDRLTYTLSGFYINRQNVSVDDIDPVTGLTISRRDGDQLVRGYEADASWSLTNEWFLLGSYGNVHSIYTDFGDANPQAIGRKVQYVAPYNGSFTVKYSPSRGSLKNFSTNLGVTFVGCDPDGNADRGRCRDRSCRPARGHFLLPPMGAHRSLLPSLEPRRPLHPPKQPEPEPYLCGEPEQCLQQAVHPRRHERSHAHPARRRPRHLLYLHDQSQRDQVLMRGSARPRSR
jgi:iron complex outermembrane recepter protein